MTAEERARLADNRVQLKQLRHDEGPNCAWVLYRDELWRRNEIGGQRVTLPPPFVRSATNAPAARSASSHSLRPSENMVV